MSYILLYNDTFKGFLSAVFYVFEYKISEVKIREISKTAKTFFDKSVVVATDDAKANRVWKGLLKRAGSTATRNIYKAYLSEIVGIEDTLLYFIKAVFKTKDATILYKNYADPMILKIAKVVRKVDREKHRMDAFVRFRLTKDGMYIATVTPDFDVLPLNASHFEKRYADQQWLIYDLRRDYGIYYDLNTVTTVKIALDKNINNAAHSNIFFTQEEHQFQELWKNYFKSTNIVSRKNTKLHLQHVPKRYWKHLSEKQV